MREEEKCSGIRPEVLKQIRVLAGRHRVRKVLLFGSRARGDYRPASDIDLAVYGGDFPRFALDVEEETQTLLEFDILDMEAPMQPELREAVEREGIPLYEKV